MRRLTAVIALCCPTVPALCQSTSKWQIAIITEVKPRQSAGDSVSDPPSYDVSVKVGDTIYVVLYTQPWRDPREVCYRARTASAGRNEHNYLQRHIGSLSSGADRKPKTRNRTQAV